MTVEFSIRRAIFGIPAVVFAGSIGLLGCTSVLGIDDAHCDPLVPECNNAAVSLCQEYCDTVQKNCTSENAVYIGSAVCLAVCQTLDAGQPNDEGVNTVQCRLQHAKKAAILADPAGECPGAGPGGDGTCGDNCAGYCSIIQAACTGKYQAFADTNACMEACSTVPDLGGFDLTRTSGNTLQCRLWHVSAAAAAANPHCAHAAGASPCD